MKKILFIGLVAATMLAGCSNDETIEVSDTSRAIAFNDVFVDKSTRATDITTSNIEDFAVYGFIENTSACVFDKEKVYKEAGSWKYDNTQYWLPEKKYFFTAIAPFDGNWEYTPTNVNAGTLTFNCSVASGGKDLVWAQALGDNGGGIQYGTNGKIESQPDAVAFTFNHLLSRVKFTFKNSFTNETSNLKVESVNVNYALKHATIDLSSTSSDLVWKKGATDGNYTMNFGQASPESGSYIAINNTGVTEHKYMIPEDQKNIAVNFTVSLYVDESLQETYSHTLTIEQFDMKMGYSYNFIVELTPDNITPGGLFPIEFTVEEVEEWNDNWEDKDIPVPDNSTEPETGA